MRYYAVKESGGEKESVMDQTIAASLPAGLKNEWQVAGKVSKWLT